MLSRSALISARSFNARIILRSAYGAGHFAKSLAWSFNDLLLAYYANMRLGLSARDTGLLLFVSMALGAALDVAAAFLLRRAEGRPRQVLMIQLVAGVATAAALLMIFHPVPKPDDPFLTLIFTLALFRIAYAFYDVAQNALASLLPEDAADAQRYVVWRQALSALARLAVAILGFLMIEQANPGREILVAGAIALLITMTAAWVFRCARVSLPLPVARGSTWLATPLGLPRLLLAGAAIAGPLCLVSRMVTFVGGRGEQGHEGAALLFAFVLGTLIGPFVLQRSWKNGYGERSASGFAILAVVAAAVFLANTRSGYLGEAACFANGIGLGAIMTMFWGEMSVAIRDHARLTGVRTDITAFAVLGATVKMSSAVCGIALGLLLDGFKAGDPQTMIVLGAITIGGGACFLLASAPSRRIDAPVVPSGAS